MKLWVDDERPAPGPPTEWVTCKTSAEAIKAMMSRFFDEISLDHDLGGDDTGMKVLEAMILEQRWPQVLTIHTANPPARAQMLLAANAEAPEWVAIFIKTW